MDRQITAAAIIILVTITLPPITPHQVQASMCPAITINQALVAITFTMVTTPPTAYSQAQAPTTHGCPTTSALLHTLTSTATKLSSGHICFQAIPTTIHNGVITAVLGITLRHTLCKVHTCTPTLSHIGTTKAHPFRINTVIGLSMNMFLPTVPPTSTLLPEATA